MSDIAGNITLLKKQIPSSVKLIAVSKTKTVKDILEIYNTGHKVFGENRVQEILTKKELLPDDIQWHLIGHLQSNKVKYIIPFISMIQSVDSFKLLSVIDAEAFKYKRKVNCLLQFHIAREETKFGFSPEEVIRMMESEEFSKLQSVIICGVMGMATYTDNEAQVRAEFRFLSECFKDLKRKYFQKEPSFAEISMGMSGDYKIAIEEGSTMVRIGSLIFGQR